MNVQQELDILRKSVPGCSLVIFGDLFSQITLCVSSSRKIQQEILDAYCVSAGNLLNGDISGSISKALGVPSGRSLSQAVVLNPDEVQVFLRSPLEDADVLCCVGSVQCEVKHLASGAGQTFERMARYQ